MPFADDRSERYVEGKQELLFTAWKEITEFDAHSSIKPEGSRISVGDGEDWMKLEGGESFWCEGHGVRWEVNGWVRTS